MATFTLQWFLFTIARINEKEILAEALHSSDAELISVSGRRRVGKTYLVDKTYGELIDYTLTGVQYATKEIQLSNFIVQLEQLTGVEWNAPLPKNWIFAFNALARALEKREATKGEKLVVFFDELPWLASKRSGFLQGFSWFWNSWAAKRKIVVVICGSAVFWMIKKIVQNKGGLHNRITRRIMVKPFSLNETADFLRSKNIFLDNRQMIEIYMAMGGIPHYLNQLVPGWSAAQSIDKICFAPNGFLQDEFDRLYPALFDHTDKHVKVVRELSKHHYGLDRKKLKKAMNMKDGGTVTKVLTELEQSGFNTSIKAYGKMKKDQIFRLTDEYSLFYLKFIEPNKNNDASTWNSLSQSQAFKIWCGYAFENIGIKHIAQIKQALGILGVRTNHASYHHQAHENHGGRSNRPTH